MLIGALVFGFQALVTALAKELRRNDLADVDWPRVCSRNDRHRQLIHLSRQASEGSGCKVIVAVFRGSLLVEQLSCLEHYGYDMEVLIPAFTREHCTWIPGWVTTGNPHNILPSPITKVVRDEDHKA